MTGWAPACMDEAEVADYRAGRVGGCRDCTTAYADEMGAIGRCNGIPGELLAGVVKEEDVDQEPIPITRRIAAEVTAPCGTCIHAGICRIEPTLRELAKLQVGLPTIDDAIRVEISAHVGCTHYSKTKIAKPAPTPKAAAKPGEDLDERRARILEAVARHNGDATAAAAELGELPHVVARIRNAAQAREAVPA